MTEDRSLRQRRHGERRHASSRTGRRRPNPNNVVTMGPEDPSVDRSHHNGTVSGLMGGLAVEVHGGGRS